MDKIAHKELEEIAPMLSALQKEDLKAPEGYFDTFSHRMLDRIKKEDINPSISLIIPMQRFTKYFAAAIVFVFMGISIFIFKINNENNANSTNEQSFTTEDIYLSEIDEASLIEYTNTIDNSTNKIEIEEYQDYIDEETIIEEINL